MSKYKKTKRELARHALGLKYGQKKSYRNYFETSEDGPDRIDWLNMVSSGLASQSSRTLFHMTYKGAQWALDQGETLCPEDFPPQSKGEA